MLVPSCKYKATNIRDIWGGGPQNFGRVCCSIGPQKFISYCIFENEFSKNWVYVVLWGPLFLEKSAKNLIRFRNFQQKIYVLRLERF